MYLECMALNANTLGDERFAVLDHGRFDLIRKIDKSIAGGVGGEGETRYKDQTDRRIYR